MPSFRVQEAAGRRLDDIYVYTRDTWSEPQAERYIRGLFARFSEIAAKRVAWRPIPAEFGIEGYFCRYGRHVIYWRESADGDVGIVTVLHDRMHQMDQFRQDDEA